MTGQAPEAPSSPNQGQDGASAVSQARRDVLRGFEAEFSGVVTVIRQATQATAARVSEGMLPATYKVLTSISRHGRATLSQLCDDLAIDKGQASRAVKDLETRGLVERSEDPEDRRSRFLALTQFGRERLSEARGPHESILLNAMQAWSNSDIARLTELLHALSKSLDTAQKRDR